MQIEAPVKYEYERIPYLVAYQNNSAVRDVYGGVAELVVLESYLLKPKTKTTDTVLVFMHPIGGGAYLPMINGLAQRAITSSTATVGSAAPTPRC
jgi:hypothetical protein